MRFDIPGSLSEQTDFELCGTDEVKIKLICCLPDIGTAATTDIFPSAATSKEFLQVNKLIAHSNAKSALDVATKIATPRNTLVPICKNLPKDSKMAGYSKKASKSAYGAMSTWNKHDAISRIPVPNQIKCKRCRIVKLKQAFSANQLSYLQVNNFLYYALAATNIFVGEDL